MKNLLSLKGWLLLCFYFLFTAPTFSQSYVDSLWTIFEDVSKPDTVRLEAISTLIINGYIYSQPDSAIHFCQLQYDFADSKGRLDWKAKALLYQGAIQNIKGNYTEAIDYLTRASEMGKEANAPLITAETFNQMANIYRVQNELLEAIKYYDLSIKYYEASPEGDAKTGGFAGNFSDLGIIYDMQGDSAQAMKHYLQGLQGYEAINFKKGIGIILGNIGTLYFERFDFEKAKHYYERAYKLQKEQKNISSCANLLNNLGAMEAQQGNLEEAFPLFKEAYEMSKPLNDPVLTSYCLSHLGRVHFEQNKFAKAKVYLTEALEISQEAGILVNTKYMAEVLKGLYKETGDYKNALAMYELQVSTQDSIKNETNQRALLRQEYDYNYEKIALADSLEFAKIQAIKDLEIEQQEATLSLQRIALFSSIIGLFLLLALVYSIFKGRKQARAEAERIKDLDQFKTRLYTNITHEFRTPLTVILGMADQVESQPKVYLEEGIELIKRNGRNLLRLINQMLDLSKLENNSFQLQWQQGDIIPYLQYLTESFHSYANGKNLALRFFSSEEALLMDYDAEQIKQVMSNLISNALKFTPSGGEVLVRIKKTGKQILLEVKDTGLGIAEKDLEKIFDRFYQIDHAMARTGEGTGIGLAHTKELVQLMDGTIAVESEAGKGSRFLVHLPIRNQAPLLLTEQEEQTMLTPPVSLQKDIPQEVIHKIGTSKNTVLASTLPRVLIIEDNPDVVIYLKSCLSQFYQIEVAYNGSIGIEMALEQIPDLIISDVMMPEKDGFEVCEILKNDDRTSHVPILLLTAKVDVASRIAGLKRGADAYLSKPFDKDELLIRLENLMTLRQRMRHAFAKQVGQSPTDLLHLNPKDEVVAVEHIFIQKIKTILEEHIGDEDFALPQLCQKVGMSRSQLFRKMKALTDTAPSVFIKNYRLHKAKFLLENTDKNVAEAAYEVGFKDPSYFSKIFQETFGSAPSTTIK